MNEPKSTCCSFGCQAVVGRGPRRGVDWDWRDRTRPLSRLVKRPCIGERRTAWADRSFSAAANAERRTGRHRPDASGRDDDPAVYTAVGLRESRSIARRLARRRESAPAAVSSGAPARSFAQAPRPARPGVAGRTASRSSSSPARRDRHRRSAASRLAGDRRRRQRPVGRPAGPDEPRRPDLRPADRRLRPDRQGRARPLPARAAPGRRLRRGPQLVLDATTTAEDRTFWQNARLRPGGDPRRGRRERERRAASAGASTITQQLVRARLLPAGRRSRAGADRYLRKAKELIQSSRLTDGATRARPASSRSSRPTSTRSSTATTPTGSPPRPHDLLRGHRPLEADARPGGAPRRPAEVALDPRPVPLRQKRHEGPPRRPADSPAGRPPQLHPREPVDVALDDADPGRARRRRSPSRSSSPATGPLSFKAPHFTWQVRRQLEQILGAGRVDRDRRLHA